MRIEVGKWYHAVDQEGRHLWFGVAHMPPGETYFGMCIWNLPGTPTDATPPESYGRHMVKAGRGDEAVELLVAWLTSRFIGMGNLVEVTLDQWR